MCVYVYINSVPVYRWVFMCLQRVWLHTERGLGILPLPQFTQKLTVQFGVVRTNGVYDIKQERWFYSLFKGKMEFANVSNPLVDYFKSSVDSFLFLSS